MMCLIAVVKGTVYVPTKPGHCQHLSQLRILLLYLSAGSQSPQRCWWTSSAKEFVALSSTPKIGLWAKGFTHPPKAMYSSRSAQQHFRQQKRQGLLELPCDQEEFVWTSRAWSCTTFMVCNSSSMWPMSTSAKRHNPDLSVPIKLQKI